VAVILAAAAALTAIAAPAADAGTPKGQVKVMTRNLYLGADLSPALTAPDGPSLAFAAQGIWNNVHTTDFPHRAKLLAAEIAKNKPDLVGLQEVALWRGDFDPPSQDGLTTPATTVQFDFLALLQKQLKKQGVSYRVVQKQQEADIEAPLSGGNPGDGRLTMRDVILANNSKKADVKTKLEDSDRYTDADSLIVNVAGLLTVVVHRGWEYTEANVRGTKFRFLNTHLEAFGDGDQPAGPLRESQAKELVKTASSSNPWGPATKGSAGTPVVAVGDFNSDDDTVSGDDQLAYNWLTSHGLTEMSTGTTATHADESCCFSAELINEAPPASLADLDHQVDHVFVTNGDATPVSTKVVGNDPAEFSQFNRWPSDHAGLVTKIQFPTD